ncbi:MAG: hypothetical protein EBU66_13020, partial [Bacteroidetes bacterium]|nr:hypothetical protein [Bacteroidota bacterium]
MEIHIGTAKLFNLIEITIRPAVILNWRFNIKLMNLHIFKYIHKMSIFDKMMKAANTCLKD